MTDEQRRLTFILGVVMAQCLATGLTPEQVEREISEALRAIRLADGPEGGPATAKAFEFVSELEKLQASGKAS